MNSETLQTTRGTENEKGAGIGLCFERVGGRCMVGRFGVGLGRQRDDLNFTIPQGKFLFLMPYGIGVWINECCPGYHILSHFLLLNGYYQQKPGSTFNLYALVTVTFLAISWHKNFIPISLPRFF